MKYKLVNPNIKGNMNTTFDGNSHYNVAQKVWNELSSYFTNNVPKFAFTLQRTKDGKLFHFLVKEKIKNDESKMVDFEISELKIKNAEKNNNKLKNIIKELDENDKKGGYRDLDDDDDDFSYQLSPYQFNPYMLNHYQLNNQPIVWWWYDPIFYQLETCFIPTFVMPLAPYVQLQLYNNWYM